ncbi:MAG: aldose 1-epimerase family protein [Ilumatobacteraceae bacterium]
MGLLPMSGRQFEIGHGAQRVTVTEVGATLRAYTVGDEPIIDGFDVDDMASGGHGQILAPWPNRLGNGRYSFEGQTERVPLNEPARANAIHGLVRWLTWHPLSVSTDAVTLRCVLQPQPAYQWRVEVDVEYRLGPTGLSVSTSVTNRSRSRAPFGIGFHPYLTVGTETVETNHLHVPGHRRLLTDDQGLPVGQAPVADTVYDFTDPRPIAGAVLDTAYTQLSRNSDGWAATILSDPRAARSVTLWVDAAYQYLMVFTGDTLDPPERRRRSVAIEPMTCPPDALRSGVDLIALDPGARWQGDWRLEPAPLS